MLDKNNEQDSLPIILKKYQPSIPESAIRDISAPHQIFDLVRPETNNTKALYLQAHKEGLISPAGKTVSIVLSFNA